MYMYVYDVQHMICGVNSVVMASMTAKTILGRIYDYSMCNAYNVGLVM